MCKFTYNRDKEFQYKIKKSLNVNYPLVRAILQEKFNKYLK